MISSRLMEVSERSSDLKDDEPLRGSHQLSMVHELVPLRLTLMHVPSRAVNREAAE